MMRFSGILSQEENISELYEKWCELERQKYKTYTQKEKEFPPLWENKVFQPVRNIIIQQVLNMQFLVEEIEVAEPELPESFAETEIEIPPQHDDEPVDSENQYYLKWNDNYKTAYEMIHDKRRNCRIICKRNCFCCRRLSQEMLLLCLNWESCMRLKSWAKRMRRSRLNSIGKHCRDF